MKKISLFITLFLIGFSALAQTDYVVTLKSDTLRGNIRILSYDQLDRAQVSIKGKKELYTALQILIVSIGNEFYKPVQIDNTVRLMKILRTGYLSLYGFKPENQNNYDGRYLVKLDGSSMEMPNIGFKKIMASYLEDCTELSEQVKKGDFGKAKLEEIVDRYNACVSKDKPAVAQPSISAEEALIKTNRMNAIQNLKSKINEQTFSTKEDALDILRDIESKVDRNENVSNYLLDGLQSSLKDQTTLAEDLSNLIALFKK